MVGSARVAEGCRVCDFQTAQLGGNDRGWTTRGRGCAASAALMPLTVLITRDVEDSYCGFLDSAMLELAPGVYAQPQMSAGVRIWTVMEEWCGRLHRGSIVMCWADAAAQGGLGLATLGEHRPRMCWRMTGCCWYDACWRAAG